MTQRAIIYARVSTHDQNCERQVSDLIAWAAAQGLFIVGTYQETGSGGDTARKARKAVLEACRKRQCDVVLVTEASRWSRSLPDLLETLETLASYRVSLRALSGIDMDLSTATGRLLVGLLGLFSEFERGLIRERVNSGLARARSRGVQLGGKRHSKVDDPAIIAEVGRLTSQGMSIRQIAKQLNVAPGTIQKARKASVSNPARHDLA